jgi:RNA polymerase sigma-70 factor, ECF subfamily
MTGMTDTGEVGASPPKDAMDPESEEWVRSLSAGGSRHERAAHRLHALLLRIARAEAARRGPRFGIAGPELDDLAHQAAADALIRISAKVTEFRGDSRFTTWAFKFVIFEVSTKLGRHFWRGSGPPPGPEDWDRLPDRLGLDPAHQAEARELAAAVRDAVEQVLSDHQRRVFAALVVAGIPADALAAELGTNRGAVYKTMFDARRKLRAHLVAHGHLRHS